jgi:uncharacterized protein (TIGR02001 family)
MKKLLLASAVASALAAPTAVLAQAAPASPHTVTGNLSFVSDYRFRGISQTYEKPAIQGGIDYSHSSGFYLGTWGSSISGLEFTNSAGLEWDFYGGYKFSAGPIGLDVGLLYYWYPGAYYNIAGQKPKYNNTEVYVGASWEWLSLKYSQTTSNLFGINSTTVGGGCGVNANNVALPGPPCLPTTGNSKGSGYLDLTATFPIATGLNVVAHYGKQKVKNFTDLSYSDYKLGVTYDAMGFTWGLSAIGTNAKEQFYRYAEGSGQAKDVSDSTVVLSVSKTF